MTADDWDNGRSLSQLLFNRFTALAFRRLRLFGVACCRSVEHIIEDPRLRQAIDRAELYADARLKPSTLAQWRRVAGKRWVATRNLQPIPPDAPISLAVEDACRPDTDGHLTWSWARLAQRAELLSIGTPAEIEQRSLTALRDIFGNPFRPVAFDPRWRSESAVALARTAYDTRNFALLPILADALEEAGCDHADILSHCRDQKAVHARGCWVVDLVLSKS